MSETRGRFSCFTLSSRISGWAAREQPSRTQPAHGSKHGNHPRSQWRDRRKPSPIWGTNGVPARSERVGNTIPALGMRLYAPILCQGSSYPQLERVSALISKAGDRVSLPIHHLSFCQQAGSQQQQWSVRSCLRQDDRMLVPARRGIVTWTG